MILNAASIDDVRAFLLQGRAAAIERLQPLGITLDAALELACAATQWMASGDVTGTALFSKWRGLSSVLSAAVALLSGEAGSTPEPDTFAAPALELYALYQRSDLTGIPWDMYRQRFNRSLQKYGFTSKLAHALSKALHEMADNVTQHSGADEFRPARGLVGYHVGPQWMSFAVVDLGRGLLDSLRTNSKWATLPDSKKALQAAIMDAATRRVHEHEGNGFKQVHKSLADLNGHLRFRSGDALLTLDGRCKDRATRLISNPALVGFQLSVSCSLAPAPLEHPLPP